ncbi:MAG TPA: hypothetical protein PK580_03775 [Nitrosomonas halophila]|nr:hypothetical protein [Nitrosomonas halophila]
MQRIILSVVLAFFCGSVAAEWTLLMSDTVRTEAPGTVAGRGTKVFIDKNSITREGTRATMYTLTDYESPLMVGGKRQLSTKSLDEYDCENRKYRTLAYYWYSRHQAKGDLVYDDTAPGRMLPVIDGSTIEDAWKIACGK